LKTRADPKFMLVGGDELAGAKDEPLFTRGDLDSVAPSGACPVPHEVPRLTPWATVFRPSGP